MQNATNILVGKWLRNGILEIENNFLFSIWKFAHKYENFNTVAKNNVKSRLKYSSKYKYRKTIEMRCHVHKYTFFF